MLGASVYGVGGTVDDRLSGVYIARTVVLPINDAQIVPRPKDRRRTRGIVCLGGRNIGFLGSEDQVRPQFAGSVHPCLPVICGTVRKQDHSRGGILTCRK